MKRTFIFLLFLIPSCVSVCPTGTYSLPGWRNCCSLDAALECGKHPGGNFAFNSSCQCSPIDCPGLFLEPMKGTQEGQIVCDLPPHHCQHNKACASATMLRESHTCNCLQIFNPCGDDGVLWGNIGGPYECVSLIVSKK